MCLLPSIPDTLPAPGVAEAVAEPGLPLNERTLAAVWNAQRPLRGPFWTTRGEPVAIVYRGRWMGGAGPDFQHAILSIGAGRPQHGDVEIHLRAGDWYAHGHHTDPAYNQVILHVVYTLGGPGRITEIQEARPAITQAGRVVPTLVLAPHLAAPHADLAALALPDHLGELSEEPCWERTLGCAVADLRATLETAGLVRLHDKAARYEAALAVATEGLPRYAWEAAADQILYAGLCDALGYSANRAAFAALAARLPVALLASLVTGRLAADRQAMLEAALLGAAGLLPAQRRLARALDWESAAQAEELERQWATTRPLLDRSGADPGAVPAWQFAGVRPANAPARRVAALAHLLTWLLPNGVLASFLGDVPAAPDPTSLRARWQARLRVAAPGGFWAEHSDFGVALARAARAATPVDLIGADRAADMVVNIVAPFVSAWGSVTGDAALTAAATAVYQTHPPLEENQITRAMRDEVFGPRARGAITTACQQQGLIHLYHHTCAERRIYECPLSGLGRRRAQDPK